jgi:hypothetical protein
MATVMVEFDMEEIKIDRLLVELKERIKAGKGVPENPVILNELLESLEELGIELGMISDYGIEVKTMDDEMKMEHISKVFQHYTSAQLEALIPLK